MTAAELGFAIPLEIITAAQSVLIEHHATDADAMLSWTAQQTMLNREMMNIVNNFAMEVLSPFSELVFDL